MKFVLFVQYKPGFVRSCPPVPDDVEVLRVMPDRWIVQMAEHIDGKCVKGGSEVGRRAGLVGLGYNQVGYCGSEEGRRT